MMLYEQEQTKAHPQQLELCKMRSSQNCILLSNGRLCKFKTHIQNKDRQSGSDDGHRDNCRNLGLLFWTVVASLPDAAERSPQKCWNWHCGDVLRNLHHLFPNNSETLPGDDIGGSLLNFGLVFRTEGIVRPRFYREWRRYFTITCEAYPRETAKIWTVSNANLALFLYS